jgi:hypothetical protein
VLVRRVEVVISRGGLGRHMSRARSLSWWLTVATAIFVCGARALEPGSPEDVVTRYLGALKEGRFDAAYDLVSKGMTQGKPKEVWVKEQKAGMAWADVKIFDYTVHPGRIEDGKAYVPNVLSSQDRFLNQLGLTEHELYTLVREDGAWKVDSQIIVAPADIPKWFPRASGGPPDEGKPAAH